VLFRLRFGLDLYVNLRPVKLYTDKLCPIKGKGPKDIDMLVGNGYCAGHAEATLELLRAEPRLRELFIRRYGGA